MAEPMPDGHMKYTKAFSGGGPGVGVAFTIYWLEPAQPKPLGPAYLPTGGKAGLARHLPINSVGLILWTTSSSNIIRILVAWVLGKP